MAENTYFMGNFALPSTTNPAASAVTVAANVQLQLYVPSGHTYCIVEYGISFAAAPSGATVTLRQTGTGSGLTTACMTPTPMNAGAPASSTTTGTTTTTSGFMNSSTAVAPAATVGQVFDAQVLSANTYIKQYPLGREPVAPASTAIQVVVTAGVVTTAYCYIIWRE
jgi:hypothetical protein